MGRRDWVAWAVIGLVSILLPVLFLFQQRWIDDLRSADRERRQAQLNAAVQRFRADLNAEFGRLVSSFPFARGGAEPDEAVAARWAEWTRESPARRFAGKLYAVSLEPEREPWARVLNTATGRFEAIGWPAELDSFRERLGMGSAGLGEPEDYSLLVFPRMPRMRREGPRGDGGFEREGPPGGPRGRGPGTGGPPGAGPGRPAGFLIVKLDRKAFESAWLGEIAARHFADAEYLVRVVDRREPSRILWEKDPGSPAGFEAPDVSAAVFRPQESGPPWRRRGGPPGDGPDPNASGAWLVQVKHRLGSLDAAVDQVHQRNQLLGGGMLLLTGAAVAVLIVSTRRARRLAGLQMEFVAGVSHELKTPLAVISSAAANLADGVVDKPEQIRRYGSVIRDQSRQLQDMVEQTLSFSRSESGRLEIERKPVPVEEIVDRALEACAPETGAMRVERKLDARLPLVMADAGALTQALRNLVSNALRYGKDGGWVGVSASAESGSVAIRVADRGRGIDSEDLPRVFEPFYRGRSAASSAVHGAGLGLSLVRKIAEAHGGKVEVQSAVGQGAEFTLRIPAVRQ